VNSLHARLTPRLIELDVFVTLALYRFDFSAGTIRYVNAGHTEGLILRADGRVAGVLGENLPLGVLEGERYVECSEPLRPGDALVVYSDGLTEARNAKGMAFGDERVRSELSGPFRLGLPPNICLQMLRRAAREFIGGGQLVDDQTVAMVAVPPRRNEKRGSTDAFDLPWDARKLEPLRTRVAAAAVALKPEMADGLVLASFEAATNIVRHVTPPFPDALLSCRIDCETDEVSVEIWYLGAAFAPPAEPTPDFSGASEGGFGLYIMQQAVSRVCHESPLPGVCCTRLVQSIAEQAAA
jgi:anti-sigma regulatory factor (Ser/Thr protein kinase)